MTTLKYIKAKYEDHRDIKLEDQDLKDILKTSSFTMVLHALPTEATNLKKKILHHSF